VKTAIDYWPAPRIMYRCPICEHPVWHADNCRYTQTLHNSLRQIGEIRDYLATKVIDKFMTDHVPGYVSPWAKWA